MKCKIVPHGFTAYLLRMHRASRYLFNQYLQYPLTLHSRLLSVRASPLNPERL